MEWNQPQSSMMATMTVIVLPPSPPSLPPLKTPCFPPYPAPQDPTPLLSSRSPLESTATTLRILTTTSAPLQCQKNVPRGRVKYHLVSASTSTDYFPNPSKLGQFIEPRACVILIQKNSYWCEKLVPTRCPSRSSYFALNPYPSLKLNLSDTSAFEGGPF